MHSPTAVQPANCKLGLLYSTRAAAVLGLLYLVPVLPYSGCCTAVHVRTRAATLYSGCCTRAAVLVDPTPTRTGTGSAVGELTQKKSELIFSHSYNFYFGHESTLGATIGAMAKFARVTNRHKFSYRLYA